VFAVDAGLPRVGSYNAEVCHAPIRCLSGLKTSTTLGLSSTWETAAPFASAVSAAFSMASCRFCLRIANLTGGGVDRYRWRIAAVQSPHLRLESGVQRRQPDPIWCLGVTKCLTRPPSNPSFSSEVPRRLPDIKGRVISGRHSGAIDIN
jgi:hypothetical protein